MPLSFGFMKRARMRMEERKKMQQRIRIQQIEGRGMKVSLRQKLIPAFIKRRQALRAETERLAREVRKAEKRAEMGKILPELEMRTNLLNEKLGTLAHRVNRAATPQERDRLLKEMDKLLPERNDNLIRIKKLHEAR